jgi:hypothetical protein
MIWLAALLLAASPAPPCTAATATKSTVERLAAHPERWAGRCVTVSGPAWEAAIYSGVGGLYLSRRWALPVSRRHRIGLYRSGGHDPAWDRPEYRTVTGTVDSCERIYRRAEAENAIEQKELDSKGEGEIIITMLGGYCHYWPGTVIHVVEESADRRIALSRLVGEGARGRYGSLVRDPAEWVSLREARAVAARVRDAIAAGNRRRLSRLFGKFGAGPDELAYLLDDPRSPFRELRDPRRRPRMAVLVEETDYGGLRLERRADRNAYLCFCRNGDCDELWPIADFDTWNRADQPYACIESEEDGAGFHFLNVRIGEAPLAEPARTAFRVQPPARPSPDSSD